MHSLDLHTFSIVVIVYIYIYIQGVPINMGINISSLFHAGLFRKHNFVVSQLKHLTPKSTSFGISILLIIKIAGDFKNLSDSNFKSAKLFIFLISPLTLKIKR